MGFEKRLAPITNWHPELDEKGDVVGYAIDSTIDEYDVSYKICKKGDHWHPKISADGHVTFCTLRGFPTAEDALAALLKRCKML